MQEQETHQAVRDMSLSDEERGHMRDTLIAYIDKDGIPFEKKKDAIRAPAIN